MANITTLPVLYHPLMGKPSITRPFCAVCSRAYPLEQHHIVKRSAGKLYRDGGEIKKPTVTLCGFGNNLQDADGHEYCHGLAHHNRLHFRWASEHPGSTLGHWEYLKTDEPTKYEKALDMDGWRSL